MCTRAICLLSVGLLAAQTAADPGATAKKALDLMLAGKYQELNQMFTPDGQKTYSLDALTKLGETIKSWGAPSNIGAPAVNRPGANFVVTIPVSFSRQNINFTIAVDPQGKLVVFLSRPGEVSWQRPPYSKPEAFKERPVVVGSGDWKLPGFLTVPSGAGPFPGIVLVHDSGPNDRDETVFGTKIFRDLAEGLSSRGIVVLRYEKRTRQYAPKMATLAAKTTVKEETVDDAVAALAALRAQPEVNQQKTYVLGFGLGGYLGPRIAAADPKLDGLVIMAGMARPLEDVLVDQFAYTGTTGKDLDGVKAQAARVKALDSGDTDSPPIMGMSAAYILDLKGYDPVATLKSMPPRVLVLQGERDFQTTIKDFNLWKNGLAGRKDTTFRSYPALNHLMTPGQGKSTEAEYKKPGHVDPQVIDDLAKWLAQ
ncbi:MAG TPA: DUF3887 domain-containing protein [Verrucomicrobiae bacterium]|nr:DUF3887 domain-containing protein [Verrucomicrobiae bacterium]